MSKLCICVLSVLLLVTPVYAVDVFKVSNYGGGCQIWFEAEAFDARDPDSENTKNIGFKLMDAETNLDLPDDAFGDAVVNVGGNDRIWLLYNFDISECGKGGTWYLRARLINPNNKSEWLWVLGDDGDEIPTVKPGNFTKAEHRTFDANIGPPWAWIVRSEGEVKELQDGENTMMFWYREGDTTAPRDVYVWCDNAAYRPTDEDYRNAEEVRLKPESVEPAGKLTTTWGTIKGAHR